MNEYELGKDIQAILHRLDKMESASVKSSDCGCSKRNTDSKSTFTISSHTYREQPEPTDEDINTILENSGQVCVWLIGLFGVRNKEIGRYPCPTLSKPGRTCPIMEVQTKTGDFQGIGPTYGAAKDDARNNFKSGGWSLDGQTGGTYLCED